jgi:hypothetical protein
MSTIVSVFGKFSAKRPPAKKVLWKDFYYNTGNEKECYYE